VGTYVVRVVGVVVVGGGGVGGVVVVKLSKQ